LLACLLRTISWKLCPTNSAWSCGPVKRWGTFWRARISFVRSAEASKASVSESTSVLSQSKRMVVICFGF